MNVTAGANAPAVLTLRQKRVSFSQNLPVLLQEDI